MTAIIDGMGSIGAAIGPMMTGYISGGPLTPRPHEHAPGTFEEIHVERASQCGFAVSAESLTDTPWVSACQNSGLVDQLVCPAFNLILLRCLPAAQSFLAALTTSSTCCTAPQQLQVRPTGRKLQYKPGSLCFPSWQITTNSLTLLCL